MTMFRFEEAYQLILKLEGGYKLTDRANDRGGMTWAGISRRWWPDWVGWIFIDAYRDNPDVPLHSIDTLRRNTRDFYYRNFWNPLRLEEVKDTRISFTIFSCAVLSSKRTATRLAQSAVKVTVDGVIGPQTINALNAIDSELFDLRLFATRVRRYIEISDDPAQSGNLRGWINRALDGLADGWPLSVAEDDEMHRLGRERA